VRGGALLTVAVVVMVLTWWLARAPQLTGDRVNLLYLSTFTRASGLLLGAGAAFVWRPWRGRAARGDVQAPVLDVVGVAAVAVLGWSFATAVLTDRSIYRWQLPVVSLASLAVVLVVVHPGSRLVRPVMSWRPFVEVGKRSYGLYLWSWPVSVALEAYSGELGRFVLAMTVTAALSELSYRFVETPIRRGALGRWFAAMRSREWQITTFAGGVTVVSLVVPLVLFFSTVDHVDPAEGGADVAFQLPVDVVAAPAAATTTSAVAGPSVVDATVAPAATSTSGPAPPATPPVLPRRVVVVGDSMAHALAVNLPDGIENTFAIADGSLDGCSVYDEGEVRSSRSSFHRSFADCDGWAAKWGAAASSSQSNLALVVVGAWDVFDVEVGGQLVAFGTPAGDRRFVDGLQQGIDALVGAGAHVALLEVACMRPQDVKGAGVPALPERGDDVRVRHVNDLLRQTAADQPDTVTFVSGPTQWCNDPVIASDLGYRWDGVHVYKPGANLVYETIAPALLAIAL
jgi:peptidoglycan/LPS O-acetylase OafA/YrhL